MWPFSRKARPEPPGVIEARRAQVRADVVIEQVSARTGEVDTYYTNLRERRIQNNFGDALVIAMERR